MSVERKLVTWNSETMVLKLTSWKLGLTGRWWVMGRSVLDVGSLSLMASTMRSMSLL